MLARHPLRYGAVLLLCSVLYLGFASAQPNNTKQPARQPLQPPLVLELHDVPRNPDDLASIEKHVQRIVERVTPCVVGIIVGPGQGSGVIISEDGYVLTAGHVSGKPNQNCIIILPSGEKLKGKTLGQDKDIDSGLIKINLDEKNKDRKFPFLDMGKSGELKKGQWVVAIGHPGGFRANRTPVVRVGRVLYVDPFAIQTDCTLVGGDSGGPLFDMKGNVIGIHSRIGGKAITENVHVPVDTYRRTWTKLAKGESWGESPGKRVTLRSEGGKEVFNKKDSLTKDDPTMPSPADKAEQAHYKKYTFRMLAGHTYTLDLIGRDKSGAQFDPFLKLEAPDGKPIAEDDDSAGFPNARIVYKALRDGDYRIIATSFDPKQTGAFTIKIFDADYKDAVVNGQVDLWKAMRIPPPQVGRVIDDFKKLEVPLHLNALLIDDKGNPLPNKEITVLWDKGKETFKSNADGVVRWALAKDKARKLNMQLPSGIRAMVALTDKNGKSIPLAQKEDPSVEKIKSAGGAIVKTIDGAIVKSDPFDIERDKCYRHVHEFKMQAGKTYTLDLISEDFDAYLRVENEEKGKLAEDDDGAGNNNSRIVFTPESSGTYRLVVTTCDPGQFGAYRLVIRETDAKPAAPSKKEEKK